MTYVLKMLGGPLDGAYLPVQRDPPPTHLAVYVPENKSWVTYHDHRDDRKMAVDVYKIRATSILPTRPPPDTKPIGMCYDGVMSPEDMLAVEQLVRERQEQERRERGGATT